MENYLALLLLVVPGFIAHQFSEKLGDTKSIESNFELTLRAMIFNIFIILVNYLLIFKANNVNVNDVKDMFNSTDFIVNYILLTLFTSIVIGFTWNIVKVHSVDIFNCIRAGMNKNKITERSVFDNTFDDGEEHIVEVNYNGVKVFGNLSQIGEYGKKEVFISGCFDYDEYRKMHPGQLNKVLGVYFDFDSNIVITEYENDVAIFEDSVGPEESENTESA